MNDTAVPAAFREALLSLQGARTRRDVRLVETPAPSRIAPFAVAINGTVLPEELETTGRFVALHDPAGQDAWNGTFRVIALVQARVEAEVGQDDLWADAAWSWLDEALSDVPHDEFGGTVTKVVSRSFGQLGRTSRRGHRRAARVVEPHRLRSCPPHRRVDRTAGHVRGRAARARRRFRASRRTCMSSRTRRAGERQRPRRPSPSC